MSNNEAEMPKEDEMFYREREAEEKNNADQGLQQEFASDSVGLILTVNKPSVHFFEPSDLQDKNRERIIKEFVNINKELGLGILDAQELLIVREYNDLIAYEIRKGYWRVAAHDISTVQTLLLASRSKQGKGLSLLFTRIVERVFKEEKEKKPLGR